MGNDTYNIDSYRFGILEPKYAKDDIEKRIKSAKTNVYTAQSLINELIEETGKVVDFSYIDVLTIKDLKRLDSIKSDAVIFIMYDIVPYITEDGDIEDVNVIRYHKMIDVEHVDEKTKLFKVLYDDLLSNYDKDNIDLSNRIKCFLERYTNLNCKEKVDKFFK